MTKNAGLYAAALICADGVFLPVPAVLSELRKNGKLRWDFHAKDGGGKTCSGRRQAEGHVFGLSGLPAAA